MQMQVNNFIHYARCDTRDTNILFRESPVHHKTRVYDPSLS